MISRSPSSWLTATLVALPWLATPLLVWWRVRGSRSLDDAPPLPNDPPLVSAIVPARDEAENIERCVRAILATTYPRLELIVVDDHSRDGTATLASAAFAGNPRARVLECPPLPTGWFGKPWACEAGARAARGDVLLFLDADTTQAPDLVPRAVATLRACGGGMLSVIGRQELGSFWERLVQPQVLAILLARYGGTERVNRSRRAVDKIANGQCILVDRATYDAIGGHGSVRGAVAEDLKLAQHAFASGRRVTLVTGERQLSTRMYTSLATLVRGWRKNVFAGGREAMPLGAIGQLLFPFLLVLPPLFGLLPPLALVWGIVTQATGLVRAAGLATASSLVFWVFVYRRSGVAVRYALAYPLGALVVLAIMVQAIARGRRVEWRGREYVTA